MKKPDEHSAIVIRDPWARPCDGYPDARVISADDRMKAVRETDDLYELTCMAVWGDTQKTVAAAAARKWMRLSKAAMKKAGGKTLSGTRFDFRANLGAAQAKGGAA